jgi:TetR/AcrR family transcriptional regulator, regulator of cefoperazone and chloramphenicol sensitivity
MKTPLEKARATPNSTKARTLKEARRLFGEYGFHGTTTRMIAQSSGVDISTLYYHWGDKADLYEAVVLDINEDLRQQLRHVEERVAGRTLAERLDIAIDEMTDYLLVHPEVSNLVLLRYFAKTRAEPITDLRVPSFISSIARAMKLADRDGPVSPEARMQVLAIMNGIYNFISGQEFFESIVGVDRDRYVALTKETLKFIFIPAFAAGAQKEA